MSVGLTFCKISIRSFLKILNQFDIDKAIIENSDIHEDILKNIDLAIDKDILENIDSNIDEYILGKKSSRS